MYVCMYTYARAHTTCHICIYIYIYIYTHIRARTHNMPYIYIRAHTHHAIRMHVCYIYNIHTSAHTQHAICMHVCIHVDMRAYTQNMSLYTYIRARTHNMSYNIYTYTRARTQHAMYVCMYTYTRAHTTCHMYVCIYARAHTTTQHTIIRICKSKITKQSFSIKSINCKNCKQTKNICFNSVAKFELYCNAKYVSKLVCNTKTTPPMASDNSLFFLFKNKGYIFGSGVLYRGSAWEALQKMKIQTR